MDGDEDNYNITIENPTKTADITPKSLTVTAENKTREYGKQNPEFTYTHSGEISGETANFTGSLATTATQTSIAGEYDITQGTLALADGTNFTASNYRISYIKGTLTIGQTEDEISIMPKTAAYTGEPIEANQATAASGTELTYEYYNGTDCSGTALSGAPIEVGEYSVKVTSVGNSSYSPGIVCVPHTIIESTPAPEFKATKSYANESVGKDNAAVKVGDVITYKITWENGNGNVVIEDKLSEGLEFVSATPKVTTQSGQNLQWSNLTEETGSITYKVKVTSTAKEKTKVCNSARAIAGTETKTLTPLCNPVPSKGYAGTGLSNNKGWNHHKVKVGNNVKYQITLTNVKDTAQVIYVKDMLSKGLTYNDDITIKNGTITDKANPSVDSTTKETTLSWTITIPANQTAVLKYSAKVNKNVVGTINNTAIVTYEGEEPIELKGLTNRIIATKQKQEIKVPDTGSQLVVAEIVSGIVLISGGAYVIYRKYKSA